MNIKDIIDKARWQFNGDIGVFATQEELEFQASHNASLDRLYDAVSDIIEKQDTRIFELEVQVARYAKCISDMLAGMPWADEAEARQILKERGES